MKHTNETGRSMVEMLGVLAIIGVLSIGGIAGYTMAMNKFSANEIVNAIVQGAIECRTRGGIPAEVYESVKGLALTCEDKSKGTVQVTINRPKEIIKAACKSTTFYKECVGGNATTPCTPQTKMACKTSGDGKDITGDSLTMYYKPVS